jgi:glutamate-1-semialdehyde 2,1-aminomutase
VNSGVRAFRAVGGVPRFITRGRGPHVWDADGNRYIDCLGSWGPLILGHAPEPVRRAIREQAAAGTSYGAPTEHEVILAEMIAAAVPGIERLRLVNSGTEAVMSALRLARAYTGRDKVIKFEGCYHGHADGMLVRAGSGAATFGLPDSPGVPEAFAGLTLTVPFNDLGAVRRLMSEVGHEIAAIIVEPIAGNMGVVPPAPGFLEGLREITYEDSALLIFDEVITGFRVGYGGAQAMFGVTPDLTTLGKVIGGGLPVGAYGGRRDIMEMIVPAGPVYQAGTLSGNPLAVRAGIETLRVLAQPEVYVELDTKGAMLESGLREAAAKAKVPVTINRVGSMMTVFFTEGSVTDYESASQSDRGRYARFFHTMLDWGIYLPPSALEAMFLSTAHTDAHVRRIISVSRKAFKAAP